MTKKRAMDFEKVEISHSYITVISNNMVVKKEDPNTFTIPLTIKVYQFVKAYYDLGESINLML